MRYEMYWEEDTFSGKAGLRWVNQPDFFPIAHLEEAYLMGHDLLEHFTMNDCSQEAEIFSIGACARVRGEDYFCYINHPTLSGWAMQDMLKDGMESCLEEMWSGAPNTEEDGFYTHLGQAESYWQNRANRTRLRNKEIDEMIDNAAFNWKLSKQKERGADIYPHQQYLLDHIQEAANIAKLGYALACRKYKRYDTDKMAQQYKAINKVMQKLLKSPEYLTFEGLRFTLSTFPGEGKARLKPEDPETQSVFKSEFGKPFIEAHAFEYVS